MSCKSWDTLLLRDRIFLTLSGPSPWRIDHFSWSPLQSPQHKPSLDLSLLWSWNFSLSAFQTKFSVDLRPSLHYASVDLSLGIIIIVSQLQTPLVDGDSLSSKGQWHCSISLSVAQRYAYLYYMKLRKKREIWGNKTLATVRELSVSLMREEQ